MRGGARFRVATVLPPIIQLVGNRTFNQTLPSSGSTSEFVPEGQTETSHSFQELYLAIRLYTSIVHSL